MCTHVIIYIHVINLNEANRTKNVIIAKIEKSKFFIRYLNDWYLLDGNVDTTTGIVGKY